MKWCIIKAATKNWYGVFMCKRVLVILPLLACYMTGQVLAQTPLRDCRRVDFKLDDSLRRGFDERLTISFDVDGDGRTDKITSRVYAIKLHRKSKSNDAATENHWISFDLRLGNGRFIKSFFKYKYGSRIGGDDVDYWVYALFPCRIKKERPINLYFYSGDDTSEEEVILLNQGNKFKVYSRKVNDDFGQ
jgi:hypothetical protein